MPDHSIGYSVVCGMATLPSTPNSDHSYVKSNLVPPQHSWVSHLISPAQENERGFTGRMKCPAEVRGPVLKPTYALPVSVQQCCLSGCRGGEGQLEHGSGVGFW